MTTQKYMSAEEAHKIASEAVEKKKILAQKTAAVISPKIHNTIKETAANGYFSHEIPAYTFGHTDYLKDAVFDDLIAHGYEVSKKEDGGLLVAWGKG